MVHSDSGADRGREQDTASAAHQRHRGLGGEKLSGDIDSKHTVEIGLRDRLQSTEILNAGIAGQQIEPTEVRHHALYQFSGLRRVADVGPVRGDLVAVATQLTDQRIGRRLIGDVIHRHRSALCGQPPHDRRADSPAAAGH